MSDFSQVKQGQAPTLLDTDRANAVLDHCHAFENMEFSPNGWASLEVNGRKAVLKQGTTAGNTAANTMTLLVVIAGVVHNVSFDATDEGVAS